MCTRSKAKLLNKAVLENCVTDDDISEKIKNYAQTINNLKQDLEKERSLSKTLVDEQEQNIKEFEGLLSENLNLKKKLYDSGEEIINLNEDIKNLTESNNLLKDDFMELEQILGTRQITQNKVELQQLQKSYDDLQIKYCDLMSQTDSRINRFITVKSCKRNTRRQCKLISSIKKITYQSTRLRAVQILLENELTRRNITITDLKSQCERFLEIIRKYEIDIKQDNRIQEKVNFLETKLKQLEGFLRRNVNQSCNTDILENTESNTIYDTDVNIRTKGNDPTQTPEFDKILMFSDACARNLGNQIYNNIKSNEKFINSCMPDANIKTILGNFENNSRNLEENDSVILLISDYNKTNARDYDSYPEMLQKKLVSCRKFKLIVCSLKFDGHNDNQIYIINEKLHHLAVINRCVKYLEINSSHWEQGFKKKTENLAAKINFCIHNYQSSSSLKFIKCNEDVEKVKDKIHTEKDFQKSELIPNLT